MIKYFTNKVLSQNLSINLAKWKRWSREFLPPDPLGGKQSGFARQYTSDEAFTVYLAGCLVSQLHFTIPETRQILKDLRPWLLSNGFRFDMGNSTPVASPDGNDTIKHHMIFIARNMRVLTEKYQNNSSFYYLIRGFISATSIDRKDNKLVEERFIETCLPPSISSSFPMMNMHFLKVMNITLLLHQFIKTLDLEPIANLHRP